MSWFDFSFMFIKIITFKYNFYTIFMHSHLEELNERPDRIEEDIKHIKEWLNKQSHLNVRTDNQWLLAFLRGCKLSLQKTKEKLDCYYTIRTLLPELFSNRDPFLPEIQDILKKGVVLPLLKTKDGIGPRIIMYRFKDCDPDLNTIVDMTKVYFMILDILINEDDNTTVAGLYSLGQFGIFPLRYILQYTPSHVKKIVTCLQSAYPIRLKGQFVNGAPSACEALFNLFKMLLSGKQRCRLHIFSENNSDKLYEYIPQSVLPEDYGGNDEFTVKLAAEWKKKVESYRDWFQEEEKYGTYEDRRPGQPHTTAEYFGVEGTFRKLAVD